MTSRYETAGKTRPSSTSNHVECGFMLSEFNGGWCSIGD